MHWLAKFVIQTVIIEGFKYLKEKTKPKKKDDKKKDEQDK